MAAAAKVSCFIFFPFQKQKRIDVGGNKALGGAKMTHEQVSSKYNAMPMLSVKVKFGKVLEMFWFCVKK
jgi:hypothetical protein